MTARDDYPLLEGPTARAAQRREMLDEIEELQKRVGPPPCPKCHGTGKIPADVEIVLDAHRLEKAVVVLHSIDLKPHPDAVGFQNLLHAARGQAQRQGLRVARRGAGDVRSPCCALRSAQMKSKPREFRAVRGWM